MVAQIFEENLSRVRVKQDAPRLEATQVLANDGDLLGFQKPFHEIDVALRYTVETFPNIEHVATTENLWLETAGVGAEFSEVADEEFPGIGAIAGSRRGAGVVTFRQHEVVH